MAQHTDTVEPTPAEFEKHERTYYGFLHLGKWFVGHVVLLVLALYFLAIQHVPVFGFFLLAVAVVVLGYGVASVGRAGAQHRP